MYCDDALAHRAGEADDLVGGLALHAHRHDEPADLRGRRLAVHDAAHDEAGLVLGERATRRHASDGAGDTRDLGHIRRGARGATGGGYRFRCLRGGSCQRHFSGHIQEVREKPGAFGSEHAFRVELHTEDRQLTMAQGHHDPVGNMGLNLEGVGNAVGLDAKRVVPRRSEGRRDTREQAAPIVHDLVGLAVHGSGCPAYARPEHVGYGLMAQTHAEHRNPGGRCCPDDVSRDTAVARRSWPRRDDDATGAKSHRFVGGHRIVAAYLDLGAESGEQLDQVVGERIVVVDDEDHATTAAETPSPLCMPAASSSAWCNALALWRHSSYSDSGTESATMPAPDWM